MKVLLYAVLFSIVFYYGCDRSHEYLDPSKEKRLSVEFLIPPSLSSPYKVDDLYIINAVITANKDSVHHADFYFINGKDTLSAIGVDSLLPRSIINDKLRDVQYFTGIIDAVPKSWDKKKIMIQVAANGAIALDSFSVE
jgi:hypothetical protein